MKKVLFITTSRADYGLLREVIIETQKSNKNTYLLITGSHFSDEFGKTFNEIKKDKIKNIIKKNIMKKKFNDKDICKYISETLHQTHKEISKIRPNVLVILGDRYELLGCAIAAMILRVPIAHIHGGEITLGAYDDYVRHSISKMSHLHFPIHEQYKRRLIQLGEDPKTIFNYGGLGAHSIKKLSYYKKKDLEKKLRIKLNKKIYLVTFHPTTLEKKKSKKQIKGLVKFLNSLNDSIIIITSSNIDNESNIIKTEFTNFAKKKNNVFFYESLGHKTYISLMKISYFIIGNSSSGMLEAPIFGTKTINIGDRQKGRIMSNNIINSDYDFKSIGKAYLKLKKRPIKASNIYYKKNTPINISKKILNFKFNLKKVFFDIPNKFQLTN